MHAIICKKYGDPKHLVSVDLPIPTPKDNEVLIKIHATAATTADTMMRRADPCIARLFLGFFRPRTQVLGTAIAGIIVAVGQNVTRFEVGDAVCGETGLNFGAYAEYAAVDADGALILKPQSISFEQAATLGDGPMTSLNFLQNLAKLQPNQRVLIIGASGSLGTAGIQIAKHMGAHVTGLCSTPNVALVQDLGADQVIDRTTTDFTKIRETYDVIYDTVGKSSFGASKHLLTPKGKYISPKLNLGLLFRMLLTSKSRKKRALFDATGMLPTDRLRGLLTQVVNIAQAPTFQTIIDRKYPLSETAAAHAYVDTGQKRGNVIITPLDEAPFN